MKKPAICIVILLAFVTPYRAHAADNDLKKQDMLMIYAEQKNRNKPPLILLKQHKDGSYGIPISRPKEHDSIDASLQEFNDETGLVFGIPDYTRKTKDNAFDPHQIARYKRKGFESLQEQSKWLKGENPLPPISTDDAHVISIFPMLVDHIPSKQISHYAQAKFIWVPENAFINAGQYKSNHVEVSKNKYPLTQLTQACAQIIYQFVIDNK